MLKDHKWKLLFSSIIILLPLLVVQTIIPPILLVVQWGCIFFTVKDPFHQNQNKKVFGMVVWICPFLSCYVSLMIERGMKGASFHPEYFTLFLVAFVFIVMGNYLPKCKQNYTIGIKIDWTLNDEENWNKTHRMAGKLWVCGGILMLFSIFLPDMISGVIIVSVMFAIILIPILYSYMIYRKKLSSGEAVHTSTQWPPKGQKSWYGKISLLFLIVICIILGVIMFTGDIHVAYTEKDFTLEASFWHDLTLEYDEIDHIEYRNQEMSGSRTAGYGSARLLMGTFKNDEFGNYTRYTYNGCDASIVIEIGDDIYVISGKDPASTKAIYEYLEKHVN